MRFYAATVAAGLLLAQALASPTAIAAGALEARQNSVVNCNPTVMETGRTKPYRVDLSRASRAVAAAGVGGGKSRYPHRFFNNEGLMFGAKHNCEKNGALLLEYPVYDVGRKKGRDWQKDTSAAKQDPTPIRAVYANANGAVYFCGVMVHRTVDKKGHGIGNFIKCE